MPSQPVRLHQGKSSERCSWHARYINSTTGTSSWSTLYLHAYQELLLGPFCLCEVLLIPWFVDSQLQLAVLSVWFLWSWNSATELVHKMIMLSESTICYLQLLRKITQVLQWVADRLTQTIILMQVPVWVQSLVTSVSTPPPPPQQQHSSL